MATQVTQCPKCKTSFRVTEAQLSIANGAVRCGSCLHIFNAPDHWIGNTAATAEEAPAKEKSASRQAKAQPAARSASRKVPDALRSLDEEPEPAFNDTIEQNALNNIFDENFITEERLEILDEEPVRDTAENTQGIGRHSSIGDSIQSEEEDDLLISDDLEIDDDAMISDGSGGDDDLLIADDLDLGDDDEGDNVKGIRDTGQHSIIESIDDDSALSSEFEDYGDDNQTGDYSESFLELDKLEAEEKGVFKDLDELGDESSSSEDDWAQKLLEDDDGDGIAAHIAEKEPEVSLEPPPAAKPKPIDEPLPEFSDENEEDDPFKDIFDDLDTDQHDSSLDAELADILNERDKTPPQQTPAEDEFVLGGEPMMAGERIGDNHRSLLANIEPEPVIFAKTSDRSRWIRAGWTVGIILAVLTLGLQYVYFNFNRLAHDEQYRGLLASACDIVGCSMPERDDIRLIRSTNLMVRSHPRATNSLVVDAIITNRASFKQRFPDMELQFTNMKGRIVAARRFSPKEYLEGEVAGMSMMPVKQPVHISLAIVDPGSDAVNYQMRLLAQEKR